MSTLVPLTSLVGVSGNSLTVWIPLTEMDLFDLAFPDGPDAIKSFDKALTALIPTPFNPT
jgi:hypothetical protein